MGGLAPGASSVGSNAPVVALSRFGVGRLASITKSILSAATSEPSTPYLSNAVPGDRIVGANAAGADRKLTAGFLAYGAAASCNAGVVIVCVRNVYAIAMSDFVVACVCRFGSTFPT